MRLNVQTDYALRMLMQLAVNEDNLVTIAEVAARYKISKNHLMKVAQALTNNGYVESIRGRSGGLRLALPADEINLGDIVRTMEADLALVECLQSSDSPCIITPSCRLKGVLKEAMNAFLDVLDQYTIDDLVRRNTSLRTLLHVEAA